MTVPVNGSFADPVAEPNGTPRWGQCRGMTQRTLCSCGCGEAASLGRSYISGHNRRAAGSVAPQPMDDIPLRQYYNRTLGRWYVVRPDGRRQLRNRYVMEQALGRPLRSDEEVHHRNRDKTDDRLTNLEVLPRRAHRVLHARENHLYEWSAIAPACLDCGRTDRKHGGHGLCRTCYRRWYLAQGSAA